MGIRGIGVQYPMPPGSAVGTAAISEDLELKEASEERLSSPGILSGWDWDGIFFTQIHEISGMKNLLKHLSGFLTFQGDKNEIDSKKQGNFQCSDLVWYAEKYM